MLFSSRAAEFNGKSCTIEHLVVDIARFLNPATSAPRAVDQRERQGRRDPLAHRGPGRDLRSHTSYKHPRRTTARSPHATIAVDTQLRTDEESCKRGESDKLVSNSVSKS